MNAARKGLAAVLTVGLAALAMWLYDIKPGLESRMLHPLMTKGHVGTAVDTPEFSVKVGKVDVASAISKPEILGKPKVMKSLGLFVIVQLEMKSNEKPFQPGHIRLITRGGVAYDETGRPEIPGPSDEYQPMLWAPAMYVFEIPKDRLAGIRLVIGNSELLNDLSSEASVDLGIDADQAARLAAHPASDYVLKTS